MAEAAEMEEMNETEVKNTFFLSTTDLTETRCDRKVLKNRYEENLPEVQNWWNQLFEILETDAAIKPEKRLPLLLEVFPRRILKKMCSILSVDHPKFKIDLPQPSKDELGALKKKKKVGSELSLIPDSKKSMIDVEEKELINKDVVTESTTIIGKRYGEFSQDAQNPYLNFFKRRPDRAAIWRELPPLSLEDMNLTQKADAIANAIATNFVEWIKTLGGDEETSINVRSLLEMFEIASQNNSTKSLKVQLKEMPSISPKVADYMGVPQKSRTYMLHREIRRDKKATKKKRRIVAFGRRLPSNMQVKPLDEKEYRKWQNCERVPEKIASMAAVWQGITHLRSTKAFCEYIFNLKPDIKAPKYLVDTGMMDPRSFYVRQDSQQTRTDSFGDVSRLAAIFK